jgi:hypothetical protein
VSQAAPHRPLAEPFSTGVPWLSRAVGVSVVLHAIAALVWWGSVKPTEEREVETVDIEIAPAPPKVEALPEEVAKPPESAPEQQANTAGTPEQPDEPDEALAMRDAGVDAPTDAGIDARKRTKPDAGIDAGADEVAPRVAEQLEPGTGDGGLAQLGADAGVALGGDAGTMVAAIESGTGTGTGSSSGSESGVAAATEEGSGSGVAGMDNQPAVDGAPTTAGTAANLLSYFPPGHEVSVLVRFDRLRKTEWAERAERLFMPMPDYQGLFGARDADIADKLDTLVISTPRPRDATATTLVVHSTIGRPKLRELLTKPDTPIAWSSSKGGMLGKRSGRLFPNDKRVLLGPWVDWIVLAAPTDLPGLLGPSKGKLDTIEAKAKLPPWLQTIRTVEQESGDEKRGPALVMTLAGPGTRYQIPDIGLGIETLPSPQRISAAMELVQQGWLIRGNIVFAKEADAAEFTHAVQEVQQRIIDSRVLSGLLKKQHALNVVAGLSLARTGARVSYATSMSIADARAILAAAAATLDAYFAGQPQPQP